VHTTLTPITKKSARASGGSRSHPPPPPTTTTPGAIHSTLAPINKKSSTTTAAATTLTTTSTTTLADTTPPSTAIAIGSGIVSVAGSSSSSSGVVRLEEISPGVFMRYVGTEAATWEGIVNGQVIILACLCCSTELHVLDSVQFVLCPNCGVTGPVGEPNDDDEHEPQNNNNSEELPAIGIGFTTDAIMAKLQYL
jgi:hypothetical protein